MYYFNGLCPDAYAAKNANLCKAEVMAGVKANPRGFYCDSACDGKTQDDAMNTAYENGARTFWLNDGGINHKQSIGTTADPVLIFVMNITDGSKAAQINANTTITGVLYVDVDYSTTQCSCRGYGNSKVECESRHRLHKGKPLHLGKRCCNLH